MFRFHRSSPGGTLIEKLCYWIVVLPEKSFRVRIAFLNFWFILWVTIVNYEQRNFTFCCSNIFVIHLPCLFIILLHLYIILITYILFIVDGECRTVQNRINLTKLYINIFSETFLDVIERLFILNIINIFFNRARNKLIVCYEKTIQDEWLYSDFTIQKKQNTTWAILFLCKQ